MKRNTIAVAVSCIALSLGVLTSTPAIASDIKSDRIASSVNIDTSASSPVMVYTDAKRKTTANVNLRKGAGTQYKSIMVIKKGTLVKYHQTKNGWSKVNANGKTGWINNKYLSKNTSSKKKSVTASNKGKNSYQRKALSYLKQFGCGNVKVTFTNKNFGGNGQADMGKQSILLKNNMPMYRMKYVTAHECAHIKQARAYNSDWNRLYKDLKRVHGKVSNVRALDLNADCVTKSLGIKEYHYTNRCTKSQLNAAKKIWKVKRVF